MVTGTVGILPGGGGWLKISLWSFVFEISTSIETPIRKPEYYNYSKSMRDSNTLKLSMDSMRKASHQYLLIPYS